MTHSMVGGERLWVEDSEGDEPALVFIHGNSLTAESWKHQVAAEELSPWRRVLFDLPGHGRSAPSEKPEHRYGLLGYAELLVELLQALEIERAILVGHSVGGHIAVEAAPDVPNLAGLFAFGMGPITGIDDLPRVFKPTPVVQFATRGELDREQAKEWAAAMFKERASMPAFAVEAILNVDPNARSLLGASAAEGRLRDEVAVARALPCPLALAHAEDDELVELRYLQSLELPLWRGAVQIIEDSGHSPQWEQPAAFNRLLREFVESAA